MLAVCRAVLLLCCLVWWATPAAAAPAVTIDPARSLFVTDNAVLHAAPDNLFSLARVFNQLVTQANVPGLSALDLWHQWWDDLNEAPGIGLGPHCNDHPLSDGHPALNGFPLQCPRREGVQATQSPFDPTIPGFYRPLALVNRVDLAPLDGSHCGEDRIIFTRVGFGSGNLARNFLIFEFQMPNPTPAAGLEGCRPLAEAWAKLSSLTDPVARAALLSEIYFTGTAGMPPVVTLAHLVAGQIRTNMFIEFLWQLREFAVEHRCRGAHQGCQSLRIVPTTVKDNPFGPLFHDPSLQPKRAGFRRALGAALLGLLPDDLMTIALQVPDTFNPGESTSQGTTNDYAAQLDPTGPLAQLLQGRLAAAGSDLSLAQVARRVMAQSCAGCHQLSTVAPGNDLGHGLTWPASLGFVHVNESGQLSPALRDVFLPHRQRVFEAFLAGQPPAAAALRGAAPGADVELTLGGVKRTH
jgi:hypothetical protein